MVCLPRMYRHRPPEIRGSSVIRKKLLLDRLAVAAHSKPRSCGMKNQRESWVSALLTAFFVKSRFAGLEFRGPATQLRHANALRSHSRTVWLLLSFS
eukprot:COSAG06_NODE_427_length_15900_cov_371.736519_12_plen_97_part_00